MKRCWIFDKIKNYITNSILNAHFQERELDDKSYEDFRTKIEERKAKRAGEIEERKQKEAERAALEEKKKQDREAEDARKAKQKEEDKQQQFTWVYFNPRTLSRFVSKFLNAFFLVWNEKSMSKIPAKKTGPKLPKLDLKTPHFSPLKKFKKCRVMIINISIRFPYASATLFPEKFLLKHPFKKSLSKQHGRYS